MNEKELKKEAGNWLRKYLLCCNCEKKCNCIDSNSYCEEQVLKAYVDSAEPREKQIQIDAEQIRALQKQNGELTDKVKELEAQIKEMKCCLSKWYEYENERDTPQINIDELLTETQQLIS